MKKLIAVLVLCSAAFAQTPDLQKKVAEMAAQHKGKVALFAKNLATGETVAIDADKPVQTASVIKLPIMIEAMHQAKAGKLKLDSRIKLTKDNQVPGSGVLSFLSPGVEMGVEDAIVLMMIVSDNTATNMVIDAVSVAAVNDRLALMGLKDTHLYKKVYKPAEGPMPADQKKFGLGKTTAREMAIVMESVHRCDVGDQALCKRMIDIMRNQQHRNLIPHYIETVDTSEIPSAIVNKTGSLDAVRNDVALIYTKRGPIVISAFTYENADQRWVPENEAELLVARLAQEIVAAWAPKGLKTGEPITADDKVPAKPHD